MTERLVQWDELEFRVSGARVNAVAREQLGSSGLPLDRLELSFQRGEIHVDARVRMKIPVPFSLVVRRIQPLGRTVRIFVEDMSAFGFLPVPAILTKLVGDREASRGIRFDAASNSVVIQLDRFLPPFLDVEIGDIHIIEGGVVVRLGRGGADLPSKTGGIPWPGVVT